MVSVDSVTTSLASRLPGWNIVIFIALIILCMVVTGVLVFRHLSKLRWPYSYVRTENVSGTGYAIPMGARGRGVARLIAFGDGGEELFFLKGIGKYRVGYGKRIGPNQIAFFQGDDGYDYQWSFGDPNKKLLEMGVFPVSKDQRFANASIRKGLEHRYPEEKTWLEQWGNILYAGMFILALLILIGGIWYSTNKQVQISQINQDSLKVSKEVQETNQKTLASIDNILSRLDIAEGKTTPLINGGSGLTPAS